MNTSHSKEVRPKPFELLLPQDQIARRIVELGHQITHDYAGRVPVLIGVLKGCVVFLADLMRTIKLPLEVEFIAAESYSKGSRRNEEIKLDQGFTKSLAGRDILRVEGVVDSGRTVLSLMELLKPVEPASVEVVTLIDKPASHRQKLNIKYVGFSLGNEFVIGFGLDNTQRYRNLPFIGKMLEE